MEITREQISKLPIFFIIGRPRSGTTLLRTLFDAHPNVSIPFECLFIGQLKRKYHRQIFSDGKKIIGFLNDLKKTKYFRINHFDEQKLFDNLNGQEKKLSYQEVCKIVVSSYDSLFQKSDIKILGDKNPFYANSFSLIFSLFPDSKFIHLVRDYRDNHTSICSARFENPIISYTVKRWKESIKTIEKYKAVHPERFYTIKYEDFVSDPGNHLKKICSFLGLSFDENMLHFQENKECFQKRYPNHIVNNVHKNLFKPITRDNIGVWKNKLTKGQTMIADYIAGKYADQYGYGKEYTGIGLWRRISAFPGLYLYYILTPIKNLALRLPFWWQLRVLRNFHRINGSFLYKFKK